MRKPSTFAGQPRWRTRLVHSLLVFPLASVLSGCLARVPEAAPVSPGAVATVPARFFAATPGTQEPPHPPGRYTLGAIALLPATDRRAAYAAPLLGREARFVQVTLRIDDLPTPRTPEVAYELVTDSGVFSALADGEWEAAVADGRTYHQNGVLLFVVPQRVQAGRLDIVDYYYPHFAGSTDPVATLLVRRVIASFDLSRLP